MTGIAPSIKVGDSFTTNEGYRVRVVKYTNFQNVLIEFQDEHKHRALVDAGNLKKGTVKNPFRRTICGVGFYGVGDYKANTPEYDAWRSMIKRCYDEKTQQRQPTYKNCTVCDAWHNFQSFAEWYTNQEHYGKGYELDKDLLVDGNKVYSPLTCLLVPQEINKLFSDNAKVRGKYPIGVILEKNKNRYLASMAVNGKSKKLGRFKTISEAAEAYQKAKKEYVKQKALEWQDRVDERLFNALMAKAA